MNILIKKWEINYFKLKIIILVYETMPFRMDKSKSKKGALWGSLFLLKISKRASINIKEHDIDVY